MAHFLLLALLQTLAQLEPVHHVPICPEALSAAQSTGPGTAPHHVWETPNWSVPSFANWS